MQDFSVYQGKTVAITGSTGGLGRELVFQLAAVRAALILLDRNQEKAAALERELLSLCPTLRIRRIAVDMADFSSVRAATEALIALSPDAFIANAGAYKIPRHITDIGYDNVFQINFISPYYMIRRLREALPDIRAVAVGSIAHTYSKIDEGDTDFRTRKSAGKVYGNAKRYLMLALHMLYRETGGYLAVVHPGITPTGITAHYPKLLYAIIKYPMRLIFMKPKRAARSLLIGLLSETPEGMWWGPRLFGIWGGPRLSCIKAYQTPDADKASRAAEEIYRSLC